MAFRGDFLWQHVANRHGGTKLLGGHPDGSYIHSWHRANRKADGAQLVPIALLDVVPKALLRSDAKVVVMLGSRVPLLRVADQRLGLNEHHRDLCSLFAPFLSHVE